MRARFLLLLLALSLLLPAAGFCGEPAAAPARETDVQQPAQREESLVGDRAKSEICAEIVDLIDGAAKEGALDESAAFALKGRLAEAAADAVDVETLFAAAPVTNDSKLARARDRFQTLRAMRGNYDDCANLSGNELKSRLLKYVSEKHRSLGYTGARNVLFSKLDNKGGKVTCVYTGRVVTCNGIPDAGGSQSMNTEHTWPKSLGAGSDPAKSDLNHLFPTDTYANSIRSSYPFGVVKNPEWSQGGSAFDGDVFMPRADHRGNVARAMFYFSVRYSKALDARQESVLREWHKADPVDEAEKTRNEGVFAAQGNRNPFIDRPEFVDRITDF